MGKGEPGEAEWENGFDRPDHEDSCSNGEAAVGLGRKQSVQGLVVGHDLGRRGAGRLFLSAFKWRWIQDR